ncbi:histidine kinase [Bacillus sp. 7586-K]|nr:histidine kinase [Bacillus sp. 7586-K]
MDMMSKKKIIIISILFLISITAIRLTWYGFLSKMDQPNPPKIENGVLDLRNWDIPKNQTFTLRGEWEFYPSQLLEGKETTATTKPELIQVPSNWKDVFKGDTKSFHYGTYRIKILVDQSEKKALGLQFNEIRKASAVYVNGKLIGGLGSPSSKQEQYEARYYPYSVAIPSGAREIDLAIQVSNHFGEGGITEQVRFGPLEAIKTRSLLSKGLQLLLCVVLLLHIFYAVLLYFLGYRKSLLFYFSMVVFCGTISVLTSDDKLLYQLLPFEYEWSIKIVFLSYLGVAAFIPQVFKQLFPEYSKFRMVHYFTGYCIFYCLFILFSPSTYLLQTSKVFLSTTLCLFVIISTVILQRAIKEKRDIIFLLLACYSIGINIFWAIIESRLSLELIHYPFDLIITLLCFTAYWFNTFFRTTNKSIQLTEKLKLANKRKDEFLVNTSHELRNPLHGIINITQSVLDDKNNPPNEEQRNNLELLISVGRRMSMMLNDLLDVTRLKEETIQLEIKSVRIQSVVTGVVEMLRFMLEGKPIKINVDIEDTFPAVKADENRLIQILFNLLHNAIKYTEEGEISVRAIVENEMARIEVADTGIGIKEEMQKVIFEPYEQVNSHLTKAGTGFGLGLSICKQLVELHGGTIKVKSTQNSGSVFYFTLPLCGEVTDLPVVVNEEVATSLLTEPSRSTLYKETEVIKSLSHNPKVLVVDDDYVNINILVSLLGTSYDLTTATSVSEAIKILEGSRFDLVISDVMMPHVSGYEFTRMIRERFTISELPVLLLTARNRSEDIVAGFRSGANDYVTKPVDSWELKSRVRALTDLKQSVERHLQVEAAWLQAQIRPHFLFNTLNSIAALGTIDIPRMQDLLMEFSNYLRTSFDYQNHEHVVKLERELSLVRSYLHIEKERFGDRLNIVWEIDADHDISIPPLSIQTLVENAVRHGILQQPNGGTIIVRLKELDEFVEVFIKDNGIGMDEDKLSNLLDSETEQTRGIGLLNTNRRLKQLYGQGLKIESSLKKGTVVSFKIPKNR